MGQSVNLDELTGHPGNRFRVEEKRFILPRRSVAVQPDSWLAGSRKREGQRRFTLEIGSQKGYGTAFPRLKRILRVTCSAN